MRWQCLLQRLRGWIPLALLCVSCSSGSFILVETLPPVGTASLQVVADLVMSPAKEVPDIPVRASDTASSFTFILALPGSATGRSLQIQVGARDKRGCLIATGSAQRDPSLQVDAVPKVEVPLSLLPAPVGCGGETPTITKVNPPTAPMNASTAVHIDGWALRAPFVVQVDGTRAPHLPSSMDPADVTVSASNRPGPTLLEVTDPFGATARSTTALSYFLPSIRFGAQNRVVRIANNGSSAPFALADLTGDGKADLAMVDYSVATVALNQGGLGFGAPQIVATSGAQQFNAVAAGDLNGDGRSDLVTLALGGSSSSLIKVLLNQGDGTFPIPRQSTYQTGVPTFDLILTDLDGDGSLDVLSTDEGSNVVELLNQGNGTFQAAPRVFPLGVPVGFVDGQSGPLPGFNGAVGDA